MKTFLICLLGSVLSISLLSCAPLVKTDLKSLTKDPEKYRGKRVIITTDLKSLVENPAPYVGKQVELTGNVEGEDRKSNYWNFILKDEEGRTVKCYEREYRVDTWIVPKMAVRQAERNNEKITVVGRLKAGLRIELDRIEYKGQTIDTDHKSPAFPTPRNWAPFQAHS